MKNFKINIILLFLISLFLISFSSCKEIVVDWNKKSESLSEPSDEPSIDLKDELVSPPNSSHDNSSTSNIIENSKDESKQSSVSKTTNSQDNSKQNIADSSKSTHEGSNLKGAAGYKQNTDLGWNLKLVNQNNTISRDFPLKLGKLENGKLFDERAIKYLNDMVAACKNDGNSIWVQSPYRTYDEQNNLFQKRYKNYLNQGNSPEKAEQLTLRYTMKAGSSEHNLGLAVDFNNIDDSFANTSASKWLLKNAENYGFILRYPKEKIDITLVQYEPWHFRYVGIENAKEINRLGFVLEEYIQYLENK